jgi:hypothetical protein
MPTKTYSRPIGYAITKLFKEAFATYKNEIYQVKDIISGSPIFLDWDTYQKMKQRIHLFDPYLTLNLPEIEFKEDKLEYFQEFSQKVPIKSIKKVICKMDEDLLQAFNCRNCGSFFKKVAAIPSTSKFIFECPKCSDKNEKHYLSQAPILIYNRALPRNRNPPKLIKSIPAKTCSKCTQNGKTTWMGLYIKDKRRPMFSLTRVCSECGHEEQLQVMPYKPVLPSEQLTKGITVSEASAKNLQEMKFVELFNREYVKGIYFSEDIKVSQVTFGYKLGQYTQTITKGFSDEYFGRNFTTQGFIIELNPSIYEKSKSYLQELYKKDHILFNEFIEDLNLEPSLSDLQLKRWVLHSLQNALLTILPIYTGLPSNEFSGTYDLNENKVIIYDNHSGGIGGCKKFQESPEIFYNYIYDTINTLVRCDCRNKCPKCIALNNDGEVNQALNRHLLVPVFDNIDTSYN